ncbi:unnamed protein product [Gongylonema pulchrum]|uniref:BED-type domain-containing protein n=1 Tax=Gongylonema pulchrum TaxID=637853 RepID=A0A183EMV2_9BILA|nr:unnamed protein product [Gongylonema pulchrum]
MFFQVVDKVTGARLPYVACFACKVLYTDTGGGTGNMTRHRCPIGSSYRDNSTGAVGDTGQHCSETGGGGQLSPDNFGAYRKESPAPSSSFHGSLTAQSSFETSFTDNDRRLFCNAIVRCCAADLLPPTIFQGEGIYGLIETALSIGRHYRWPERQSIATLIPDIFALNLVIEESSAMVLSELTAEISQIARTSGFSFSVERMTIEDEIAVVSANYITADWKYKHRVMNVSTFEKISDGLETLLREIGETKRMAYVTENIHCSGDQAHLSCICYTLNNVIL